MVARALLEQPLQHGFVEFHQPVLSPRLPPSLQQTPATELIPPSPMPPMLVIVTTTSETVDN